MNIKAVTSCMAMHWKKKALKSQLSDYTFQASHCDLSLSADIQLTHLISANLHTQWRKHNYFPQPTKVKWTLMAWKKGYVCKSVRATWKRHARMSILAQQRGEVKDALRINLRYINTTLIYKTVTFSTLFL